MESLKMHNTFGLEVYADKVYNIASVEELKKLIVSGKFRDSNPMILGSGSNVLFKGNYG